MRLKSRVSPRLSRYSHVLSGSQPVCILRLPATCPAHLTAPRPPIPEGLYTVTGTTPPLPGCHHCPRTSTCPPGVWLVLLLAQLGFAPGHTFPVTLCCPQHAALLPLSVSASRGYKPPRSQHLALAGRGGLRLGPSYLGGWGGRTA